MCVTCRNVEVSSPPDDVMDRFLNEAPDYMGDQEGSTANRWRCKVAPYFVSKVALFKLHVISLNTLKGLFKILKKEGDQAAQATQSHNIIDRAFSTLVEYYQNGLLTNKHNLNDEFHSFVVCALCVQLPFDHPLTPTYYACRGRTIG